MELRSARYVDVVILRPVGRIDYANAEAFSQALAGHLVDCAGGHDSLLFDLADLDYISSAGLRVLMLASKAVVPRGGKVVIASPRKVVREILEISRFQHVFPVHATVIAGLSALSPAAATAYGARP
ncbi:MAG: STAS domain-containing protein [Panacagrimonas sp.]